VTGKRRKAQAGKHKQANRIIKRRLKIVEDNEETDREDTQKGKFLSFNVDSETYGIEIRYVTEIISIEEITEMPETPAYMKGIINLRGNIIPVMDVRLRFKMEPSAYTDRTCIIVVNFNGVSVGLIVGSVSDVITVDDDAVVNLTKQESGFSNRYIRTVGRIGDQVILMVDCVSLLSFEEISEFC
jgi:purine-binding chemotaxis protein CheW